MASWLFPNEEAIGQFINLPVSNYNCNFSFFFSSDLKVTRKRRERFRSERYFPAVFMQLASCAICLELLGSFLVRVRFLELRPIFGLHALHASSCFTAVDD